MAIRDRRWAQGNLQHMKIIGSSGLSFASRMHLGVGIMSYLSSPLWLIMLGIGFALAVQSHLIRPSISITISNCSPPGRVSTSN